MTDETERQMSAHPWPGPPAPQTGRQRGGGGGLWGCSTGAELLEEAPFPLCPQSLAVIGEAWEPWKGTVVFTE